MADDIRLGFADNPHIRPEHQRIYQAIADSTSETQEDEEEERP